MVVYSSNMGVDERHNVGITVWYKITGMCCVNLVTECVGIFLFVFFSSMSVFDVTEAE